MSAHAQRIAFTLLVALVAGQRLWELARSRENERALRLRGAREHAPDQMPFMRGLHAAWLVGMLVEVWVLHRAPSLWLAVPALVVFAIGQALRLAAMRALGDRWNVKILTLPGEPPVLGGVFAHLRHPNYLGVALEMGALPLVGGAIGTALIASVLNGLLLVLRIRAEETALHQDNDYAQLRDRPRLVPSLARRR